MSSSARLAVRHIEHRGGPTGSRLGRPRLALQVVHYSVLDLVTAPNAKPGGQRGRVPPPWMGTEFTMCYTPDAATRKNPLVSPAWVPNSENLAGIAPAVVVTAEHDKLRDEAARYAHALEAVGALRLYHEIPGVDHGYDIRDRTPEITKEVYQLLSDHIAEALHGKRPSPGAGPDHDDHTAASTWGRTMTDGEHNVAGVSAFLRRTPPPAPDPAKESPQ